MSDPAAFSGNYANIITRKTRSVAVVEIEIPIEKMQAFIAAFGAPLPGVEIPVAIARLDPKAADKAKEPPATKERRPFSDLPFAQQAGIRCEDVRFKKFIVESYGAAFSDEFVRQFCGIKSRSELASDHDAIRHWKKLNSQFEAWLAT